MSAPSFDYARLDALQREHPAWRLLRADHAPLIVSFLHRVFVAPNVRTHRAADLEEALEDELFALRQQLGEGTFPRAALDYLNEWAAQEKGWLRKFYASADDEPQFDLTPAAEKAIAWLATLQERAFVGTESRLLTLFELLRQMRDGSETNPDKRIEELRKRRAEIDRQISDAEQGQITVLDGTALKERFMQFTQVARELLSDFRQVEQNFRALDRRVRERIALWDGNKGALLSEVIGERDAITDSDEGRSFRAFFEFLMSSQRQDELSALLDHVLHLPAIDELRPDRRLKRVHHDWLEAGEHTQRTVAQLSQQLRHFLDDRAWYDNRRIMEIIRQIEANALALRATPPEGHVASIDEMGLDVGLPFERPLYTPKPRVALDDVSPDTGEVPVDVSALYTQVVVDKGLLVRHIQQALQDQTEISLGELLARFPLTHGLAELVAYIQIADTGEVSAHIDDGRQELVIWARDGVTRQAEVPLVVFAR